jgi:hypothetical protein
MNVPQLGRLEQLDLRQVWASEALAFTPWLAQPENLAALGDTLRMDLELEAQEKAVGPFRADLLCKDVATDSWVLIENQLERTDHSHLGQLLIYAAGLQAVTIVWIAARFTEEHRATLDLLNKITDESFRFFGLEIELWRIGNSMPAPKFNIVAKPNDWSRSVIQAARAIDDSELSDTRLTQQRYWTALNAALDAAAGPISGNRQARPQSWMTFPIGRVRFHLAAAMLRTARQVRAELYLSGSDAKAHFGLLEQQRAEIEAELGYPLAWEKLPDGQDSRISVYLKDADPMDERDWPRQHQWLAQRLNDFHRAFAQRIRSLDASAWSGQAASET